MGLTMSTGHCKNATSGSDDERWPAKPVSWKSFSSSLLPGRINTRRLGVFSPREGIDDGFMWILGNFRVGSMMTGWWFQTFFIFQNIWDNHPN